MDGPFELRLNVPFNKVEHSVVDRRQHGASGREVCRQANDGKSSVRKYMQVEFSSKIIIKENKRKREKKGTDILD